MATPDATATQFGWDFQINSAILLFLENYRNTNRIKVEGRTQDIEILLNSGKYIFAQAKAFVDPDDTRNVEKQLKSALKTLSIKEKIYINLIYITNSNNPFKVRPEYFRGNTSLPYNDLPNDCKKKITKHLLNLEAEAKVKGIKIEFDQDAFITKKFDFYGSVISNRHKHIKQVVVEFLTDIEPEFANFSKKLIDTWQLDFFHNTTIRDVTLSKSDLMWPLIFFVCESPVVYDQESTILDEAEYEYVFEKYKNFITKTSEKFAFATKVLTDYQNFYTTTVEKRNAIRDFTLAYWHTYNAEFSFLKLTPNINENVIKMVIWTILKKKRNISTVKEKIGL